MTVNELAKRLAGIKKDGYGDSEVRVSVTHDEGTNEGQDIDLEIKADNPGPCHTCRHDPGVSNYVEIRGQS